MTEMGTRWLTTVVILDKGMIHILVGQSRTAWDVIKLLRIAHNLKLRNCSIWKFPFHIFGLQLTADNWNHRKQNLRWGETTVISTRNQIGIFFFFPARLEHSFPTHKLPLPVMWPISAIFPALLRHQSAQWIIFLLIVGVCAWTSSHNNVAEKALDWESGNLVLAPHLSFNQLVTLWFLQ